MTKEQNEKEVKRILLEIRAKKIFYPLIALLLLVMVSFILYKLLLNPISIIFIFVLGLIIMLLSSIR